MAQTSTATTERRTTSSILEGDRRLMGAASRIFPLAALYHGGLVGLFHALDCDWMAVVNVASTAIWLVGTVLLRRGRLGIAMGLVFAELLVHASLATVGVGAEAGFHYYLLAMLVAALLMSGRRTFKIVSVALCLTALCTMLSAEVLGLVPTPLSAVLARKVRAFNLVGTAGTLALIASYYSRRAEELEDEVRQEYRRSESLLRNILPETVAERLKRDEGTIAERFDDVSVLFADISGFTPLSAKVEPEGLVELLNRIFSELDRLCDEHGLEKIKTIGDAYMVAGGLPVPTEDHAASVARFALASVAAVEAVSRAEGHPLQMRIGIHCGPAVAGVIGTRKFSYDVWGDTVNVAARMESHGEPGRIQVSAAVAERLADRFVFEERGPQSVKGKGLMSCFYLVGERPPVAT